MILFLTAVSCEQPKTKVEKENETLVKGRLADSIEKVVMENAENSLTEALSDTSGIYKAPIKVTKARFVEKDYSNYKDIQLTYKNVSGKDIEAIRFNWTGLNAFGEPADVGSVYGDVGGGFIDTKLRAGKTTTSTWSILSRDGKKVTKAWAREVVFSDGTKWEFKPEKQKQ